MANIILKPVDPGFTQLSELASESSGGKILFATDDFFAPAEWMLKDSEPVFIPEKYTDCGKWMDGWETRRKRISGHDWCIIKLGAPTKIRGVMLDTAYFTGNFAPRFSLQGSYLSEKDEAAIPERNSKMGNACTDDELFAMSRVRSENWIEVIEMTKLLPGYEETKKQYFTVTNSNDCFTHLRLNIYPDGGVARLRVFGDVVPDVPKLMCNPEVDLLGLLNGGVCLGFSNAHFGHPKNLIKPSKGVNMGDGWETARRLDRPVVLETDSFGILQVPGCEWAVFKLCSKGIIEKIVVDTNHFKGNFPDNVKIEGAFLQPNETLQSVKWNIILDNSKLSANREHFYDENCFKTMAPMTHVKVTMAPDGGISRVRLYGKLVQ